MQQQEGTERRHEVRRIPSLPASTQFSANRQVLISSLTHRVHGPVLREAAIHHLTFRGTLPELG